MKISFGSLLVLLLLVFGVGWVVYRSFKKSEDPRRLLFKWIFTLIVVCFIFYVVFPIIAEGGYGAAFGGVPLAAACGVALAITWRRSIGEWIASPLSSLFDGGDEQIEARAVYSKATKLRQRNQFNEAIMEVRAQLARFPDDFAGQMLLAEINAENLQDLQSAEIIIQKIAAQSKHNPAQIVGALHALADWHMKLAQDPESARAVLQQIIERFPDSQFSQTAAQRMAHLGSVDSLLASHHRPAVALKHFDPYANLAESAQKDFSVQDAAMQAQICLKQLDQHPFDTEAREKLALIYAHDYQRLDLAADQIEQLIAQPNQRGKQVARWLNLLADLQIKIGNDIPMADQTIRRIQELLPGTAYAEQAGVRLEYLRMEAKRNDKSQGLKLGLYEKDLGLKKPAN